jgi:cytochrome b561
MGSSASASLAIERHPLVTRVLHWATAVILVVSVSAILYRETTEHTTVRQVLMELHRQLGLLVLVVLVARVAVRSVKGLVNHAAGLSAGVRRAATLAHWSMYGVLAGLILLGWAQCNAHAIHLRLFGVIRLPDLVAADSELADTLSDYHIWAAWVLLALVVPHVLAALWHHYIRRDGVLTAMLPGNAVIATKPAVAPARPVLSLVARTLRKVRARRAPRAARQSRPL